MHRTQIMLEEEQYERLKAESRRNGRSMGDLIRAAVDQVYGGADRAASLRDALQQASGAWSHLDVDGATYVEGLRRGLGSRLADLGVE